MAGDRVVNAPFKEGEGVEELLVMWFLGKRRFPRNQTMSITGSTGKKRGIPLSANPSRCKEN